MPQNVSDCSEVSVTIEDQGDMSGCAYSFLREYTFTDVCGNTSVARQLVNVADTIPPTFLQKPLDFILSCTSDLTDLTFRSWVSSMADAIPLQGCGGVRSFAAIPGSYDPSDTTSFPGIPPGDLDNNGCGGAVPGFIFHEVVDYVFYDDCGNVAVEPAVYGIRDISPPVITSCPEDVTLSVEEGGCAVMYTLPPVSGVDDNCVVAESMPEITLRQDIVSVNPDDPDSPVRSVRLQYGPFPAYFLQIIEDGTLSIDYNFIDGNEVDERFLIISETGDTLGFSPLTSLECGSTSQTVTVDNAILESSILDDGIITIILFPLTSEDPVDRINDICGDSFVEATLSFKTNADDNISVELIIDGDSRGNFSSDMDEVLIDAGVHDILYVVRDCAQNADTCSFQITVEDDTPPEIICPDDITVILDDVNCNQGVAIPLDYVVMENCNGNVVYNQTLPETEESALLNFSASGVEGVFLVDNVQFSFSEGFSIDHIDKGGLLEVTVVGDFNDEGEFFQILDEDGIPIGQIGSSGTEGCGSITERFEVSKAQINDWLSDDGEIEISFISNQSSQVEGGGINPCIDLIEEGVDFMSSLSATLRYTDAIVSYSATGASMIVETMTAPGDDTLFLDLESGISTLSYLVSDQLGNTGNCSFNISIVDTIAPVVSCKNAVIFIDPSGNEDYTLTVEEILVEGTDNCGVEGFTIEPQVFSCADIGEEISVNLTIRDTGGNTSTCGSLVVPRTTLIEPAFSVGLCDSDTLKLFANPPPSDVPNNYTFLWTGPNFSSMQENPVIAGASANNNGTYVVEITGFNGCTSTGSVDVIVDELTEPSLESSSPQVCVGDELILSTRGQSGEISYEWYEGTFPNGLLLETTTSPSYVLTPNLGSHRYYLIINKGDCVTNPSPMTIVEVIDIPDASVRETFITICEGEDIVLGTDLTGDGFSYLWQGPNNFTSSMQNPDTIKNASTINAGDYSLVIQLSGCAPDTAFAQVAVFSTPTRPEITSGEVFCEGNNIVLTVNNVPNADLYMWYQNGTLRSTTPVNSLVLENATSVLAGSWTVEVTEGPCSSEQSEEQNIIVETELLISADNNGPGCDGDSILLSSSFVPGAIYSWTGPGGFTSDMQNPMIPALQGDYFVSVTTESGCNGESSTSVVVTLPPEITALSSDALECMDGASPVTFSPSVFPQGDYQVSWMGPNGFMSSELNASIPNFTSENNGVYTLIISDGLCASEPAMIEVDVTTIPEKPVLVGSVNFCVGDELAIDTDEVPNAVNYIWTTPQGQRVTELPRLVIPDLEVENSGNYSLQVQVGNCRSSSSDPLSVSIASIPIQPSISSDSSVCPGDTLFLSATNIQDVTYSWSGPNGFTSSEREPSIPGIAQENEGDYIVAVQRQGCVLESLPFNLQLAEVPRAPIPETRTVSVCNTSDASIEICFDRVSNSELVLFTEDNVEIARSGSDCILITDLSIFSSGVNSVTAVSEIGGCSSVSSSIIELNLIDAPIIDAEAEDNPVFTCGENTVMIQSLFGEPDVITSWNLVSGEGDIRIIDDRTIEVNNLGDGRNQVELTYSTEVCPDFSSTIIEVVQATDPETENDNYVLRNPELIVLDVFDNDDIPPGAEINITTEPEFGDATIVEDGIEYDPNSGFIGRLVFRYEVCLPACNSCSEAEVILNLGDASNCVAPTLITPNGDGINDAFVVPCLYSGSYAESELQVFNQWGKLIYNQENYQNDWEGTYSGSPLPTGTYYYILKLNDDSDNIIGFLTIER